MALDLEFAQPAAASVGVAAGAGAHGRPNACWDQLALMQCAVPAVGSFDAWIYVLEVPEEQQPASSLMRHLAPLLQDAGVIKVMHNARQDGVVLQRQFGICLRGVLDTQLLAGCSALAGSLAAPQGAQQQPEDEGKEGGSSRQAAAPPFLGRLGLGRLYAAYGLPHPGKDIMQQAFEANPRCGLSRVVEGLAVGWLAGFQHRARQKWRSSNVC